MLVELTLSRVRIPLRGLNSKAIVIILFGLRICLPDIFHLENKYNSVMARSIFPRKPYFFIYNYILFYI